MIVANKNKPQEENFEIKINDVKLKQCTSYKYLGVYIDEELNWKSHVNYLCEKISKVCGIFAKLRHCVGFDILKTVYHALVASHLNYCNLIWGNANNYVLKPLITLQNRVLKIMTFAPFATSNVKQIYDDLELLNLNQMHNLAKAKFAYKHKNDMLPSNFDNYLHSTESIHTRNLRSTSSGNYRQVWGKLSHGFEMIQYDGAKLWNSIPVNIRNVENLKNFSEIYKIHLLNEN